MAIVLTVPNYKKVALRQNPTAPTLTVLQLWRWEVVVKPEAFAVAGGAHPTANQQTETAEVIIPTGTEFSCS